MSAKYGWCLTGDHAACPGAASASDALVPACGCQCHAAGVRPRPPGESVVPHGSGHDYDPSAEDEDPCTRCGKPYADCREEWPDNLTCCCVNCTHLGNQRRADREHARFAAMESPASLW